VLTRRTEFELERARRRAHILEGLKKALDIIDQIIATIRASNSTEQARTNLMTQYDFTEIQAQAILDMRLARLAALERERIENELKDVLAEIEYLEGLLADPNLILGLIGDDMERLKDKYGDERMTAISSASGDLSDEDLIPNADVMITLTKRGYVKRIGMDAFGTQRRGGKGVKGLKVREEDDPLHQIKANNHDILLVFTDKGRVFGTKVYEIPEASRIAQGLPIVNVLALQPDENVATLLPVRDFKEGNFLFFSTRRGQVKRTEIRQFQNIRSNGLIAIGLDPEDELAWVRVTSGEDDIIQVTELGQAIRYAETDVRAMGRQAAGVRGINLAAKDKVIATEVVRPEEQLLVIGSKGLGKRTPLDQFTRIRRGGKGVTAMKLTDRTGVIVGARMVRGDEQVVLLSSAGQVIRIPCEQINKSGRATQGVTLMRMNGASETVLSIEVFTPTEVADLPTEDANGAGPAT
jgi:DNA gyrase subunit A